MSGCADPDSVFTLVVDELHLYRGSAGAEVAMVVRNLMSRLGLEPTSPQLRIIGTSASLPGDESGRSYLESFFGVAAATLRRSKAADRASRRQRRRRTLPRSPRTAVPRPPSPAGLGAGLGVDDRRSRASDDGGELPRARDTADHRTSAVRRRARRRARPCAR